MTELTRSNTDSWLETISVRNGGPWRTTIKYREPNAASKQGRRIKYVTCYGRTKKDSIASANIQIQLRVEDAKSKRMETSV